MSEEWRPVKGYEDLYEVSSEGRVRRRPNTPRCVKGRVLKLKRYFKHYLGVDLSAGGAVNRHAVHNLVAHAFLAPAPGPNYEVNHKDGDKHRNVVSNLEWMTRSENILHSYRTLKRPVRDMSGSKNPRAKLTDAQVAEIRALKGKLTQKALAERFRVSKATIFYVLKGEHWK